MSVYLNVYGKHLSVATRARRRSLIILFYGIFAGLDFAAWLVNPTGEAAWFTVIGYTLLVGSALGGHFAASSLTGNTLVRPFNGNEQLRSRFARRFVTADAAKNDERDLDRRNRAHYGAFRVLQIVVGLALLPDMFLSLSLGHRIGTISLLVAQKAIRVDLQIAYLLLLTLPAAIVLWSEPDLDSDPEDPHTQTIYGAFPQEHP